MVYLIHFEEKIGKAQHYLGYTKNLESRMYYHRNGNGAAILRACNERNIKYDVVREWDGADGNFERKLKKFKKSKRLCPICNSKTWETNGVFE